VKGLFTGRRGVAALLFGLAALAVRLHNAFRYPPDWGYDATFNWRYIYRMTEDWALPNPAAGWSTADPPLFFTVSAAMMNATSFQLVLIPLLNTALGLGIAALAVLLVRRADPARPLRALLAGGLLLYLPAHVYMSVMVNEEMLVAFFTSLTLFALVPADSGDDRRSAGGLARAAAVGAAAGLALLSKLTGALAVATAVGHTAWLGWQRRDLRGTALRVAIVAVVAALVGGWFFARNRVLFGSFQPFGLPAHQRMFEMPPGERSLRDYVDIPLATWSDPVLTNPELLHSVWGSTFATLWFDGHRYFLPRDSRAVSRLGSAALVLALLPTAAFLAGLWGGIRRALRAPTGPDPPLVLITALTLLGYAVYNWQNPWFVVVKGTTLLGLSLPFAFYASEALERWIRNAGRWSAVYWVPLALLAVTTILSCTFNLAFDKTEVSGLPWQLSEE
jgi:4-amino-4-deoxy-L-arabinose transferase-like glycosyltransferase